MTRWSRVTRDEGWWDELGGLSEEVLRRIASEVLPRTPEFIRPSFEGLYSQEYAAYFRRILDPGFLDAYDRRQYGEIVDQMMILDEEESESVPGAASLSAGVVAFFEGMTVRFDGPRVFEVLHQCYEAVLHAELLPGSVLEAGEDNEHCVEFIDFQRNVIRQASGRV